MRCTFLLLSLLLLTLLTGCFRDASDSDKAPTAREVNLQDIQAQQSLTPAPFTATTAPAATNTNTVAAIPIAISPTTENTLTVGGPPAEDNQENNNTTASENNITPTTEDPPTATEAPPSATASPTIPTATATITRIPLSEATVGRPSFGDTGISPTPSHTFTPTQEVLATPTELLPSDECIYLVQGGDTISAIARELEVDTEALYLANPELRLNPDSLQVGQQIRLPGCVSEDDEEGADNTNGTSDSEEGENNAGTTLEAPEGSVIHIVESGDTLYSLAQRYNTTVEAIVAANENLITEETRIYPDEELIIPVGSEE